MENTVDLHPYCIQLHSCLLLVLLGIIYVSEYLCLAKRRCHYMGSKMPPIGGTVIYLLFVISQLITVLNNIVTTAEDKCIQSFGWKIRGKETAQKTRC